LKVLRLSVVVGVVRWFMVVVLSRIEVMVLVLMLSLVGDGLVIVHGIKFICVR
jgi:hypothetical protein